MNDLGSHIFDMAVGINRMKAAEITQQELTRDREYLDHKEPHRHYTCFECGKVFHDSCHTSVFDGRYHFCNECDTAYTEVMDEIDAARRRALMDLDYLKRMCKDALSTNDFDYLKGSIERAIAWIELTPDEKIKTIRGAV